MILAAIVAPDLYRLALATITGVANLFRVTPAKLVEGHRPHIRLRIEQPGSKRISARVVVVNLN